MKIRKIVFIATWMLSVVSVRAQQPALVDLFGRYAAREGFTSIELGRKMMQMMSRRSDSDPALAHLLDGITAIRIVATDGCDQEFAAAVSAVAASSPYRLLSSLTERGQTTSFYLIDGSEREYQMFIPNKGMVTVTDKGGGQVSTKLDPRTVKLDPQSVMDLTGKQGHSEFLMITCGQKETVMVDIVGMFDVAEVSRLSTLRPR